jgi:hypothetical protein
MLAHRLFHTAKLLNRDMKTYRPFTNAFCALAALVLALSASTIHAQSFAIDWYKVSGTGATYQVTGTIGQADAGGADDGRLLEPHFRSTDSGNAAPHHYARREQRHRLLARHRELYLAAEHRGGHDELGDQRLHGYHWRRHEQRHLYPRTGPVVLPAEAVRAPF